MKNPIRILFVEDLPTDLELMILEIKRAGISFEHRVVETRKDYVDALYRFQPNLILSDFSLPRFDGMQALEIRNELDPIIPFILVTGSMNEETAITCILEGATDYLLKDNLKRIGHAIETAMHAAQLLKEKKETEQALIEAEARYRNFFEKDITGDYLSTIEGYFMDCNPAFARMLGYDSPDEIMAIPTINLYPNPTDRDVFLKELKKHKILENSELRMKKKDGSVINCIENVLGLFDKAGQLIQIQGYMVDITQKKQMEIALKESEEKFRTIFEKSPIGIELYDKDGIQIMANKASYEMFGIHDNSSSGFNLFDGTSLTEFLKEKLKQGEAVSYEALFDFDKIMEMNQYVTSRNGIANMAYLITPIITKDKEDIQGYLLQVQEITSRKRSELIQHVLFNISNAVSMKVDMRALTKKIQVELNRLIDTSNFYIAFYDEVSGLLSTPFAKDEKDQIDTWLAEKSLTGIVIKQDKPLLSTKADSLAMHERGEINLVGTIAESWLGVPLHANGTVTGAFVVQSYRDPHAYCQKDVEMLEFVSDQISLSVQRKKAEQDIHDALEKAQESDRLKSAFLANMSHEIRTPMNAILGFSELLSQPDMTPNETERFTGIIRNAGVKLMHIIDDIIDLSKLEAKQVRISKSACQVNHLMITTFSSFENHELLTTKKGLSLNLNLSGIADNTETETDPVRLQQVLDNLITNALKFTDKGTVEIGVEKMEKEGVPWLKFFVTDTGKGIPREKLSIIFERFRQVEEEEYHEGAGLGLSISKSLVELLGGEIDVISQPGKGSTFTVMIPLISAFSKPVSGSKFTGNKPFSLKGKKILIVDDDPDSVYYLTVLLQETQASLSVAHHGIMMMEMLKQALPDLILLDINMPEKSGFECIKDIKAKGYPVKIIVQTAYAMEGEKRKCIELGCHAYLAKPFSKKQLFETIEEVLA